MGGRPQFLLPSGAENPHSWHGINDYADTFHNIAYTQMVDIIELCMSTYPFLSTSRLSSPLHKNRPIGLPVSKRWEVAYGQVVTVPAGREQRKLLSRRRDAVVPLTETRRNVLMTSQKPSHPSSPGRHALAACNYTANISIKRKSEVSQIVKLSSYSDSAAAG